ncbi:pleckstrin homology domain-containing family G member 3-like isoform X2 [Cyclopterus lumpus]|uniref:pleckstrin homology domain-containing family G member 3-like isoform X2 n=1 Tax=Cyclopterus lumpus TaxID=8103 RepID=UPI0014867D63|nr:pleckstrin homology domain-containing family G member 3-like isoform X2 [Cyclopterus lumpus]
MPEGAHSSSCDGLMDEDSHRLSAASVSSNERRPASLISTLSSGSGSSQDDNLAPPPSTQTSDVDLDLSSAGDAAKGEKGEWPHPEKDIKGRSVGLVHNNNSNKGSMTPNPQLTYLNRVLMEIIETERTYVRDLRMIVEDYLAHIIDQCDLSIRPEQVCSLFGNIEDIYEFNSELLQSLDLCDHDPVAVARCFVLKSEYFEIYTQYCTNYPNSVAALTECMRNKSLAKFFRERQASLKRSLPLGSYLLKPVQRILKYHLLLQEIAKHFDPQEAGYEVVEEAIYTMTGVAWYINDMKRKHEHAVRLQEVQSLLLNWKGPDLTTYGELVLEGTFKVHRAKNERTLFLFDRMLLITKRRGEHYVYKTHISCSTLMLIESAKDSLSFSVTHYKHPKQPHTVQAKTVEEKKLWAHHIKRIILENHQAIIPQKAKEAILEMDSIYPPRYRVKKSSSCQSGEFPTDGRHGRRQSEPIKEILKSSKVILKRGRGSLSLGECEEDQEEEEELSSRKNSLERLISGDEEDFTSSVLAAVSFWAQMAGGGGVSSGEGGVSSDSRLPEKDKPGGTEPTREQPSTDKLPQEKTSEFESTENPEPEPCDPDSLSAPRPGFPASPPRSEEQKPEGDQETTEQPSPAAPDSDSKTLSSGESSEDEDEEDLKAPVKEGQAISILPSSVLDKASAIAQHFTNSIKRGSLAQDDARALGCASPRLPSRTGNSLSAEPADQISRLNSICSDPAENFGLTDLTLLSPRDDILFDAERGIRRRRDSTLSKQDQLLIGKIRSYYENAENQDAAFSLQRRESLTYIPTGLVRSSVSRLNSTPKEEAIQTNPSTSTTSTSLESSSALTTGPQGHMVLSDSLDFFRSDQRITDPEDSEDSHWFRSQGLQDKPSADEEFRPSSEMIKIWQTMEREIDRSHSDNLRQSREAPKSSSPTNIGLSDTTKTSNQSGASDLSTTAKGSVSPSPLKLKPSGVSRTGSLKVFGDEAATLRALGPRVTQLKPEGETAGEDSNQLDDGDKTKSKVLHLARQYSQRIKTTKPMFRQQSQGVLMGRKTLPCLAEEKEGPGKPNPTPPLVSHNQATSLPLSPVDQIQASGLSCSSAVLDPGRARSRSPLIPLGIPPPVEGFSWPDVRELRSRYSAHHRSPVGRSLSIPEQMLDGGRRRRSSCSSGLLLADEASTEVPPYGPRGSREERRKRLHRANSLDPRLSGYQRRELQELQDQVYDGYYVAADAPLPNDEEQKILVEEKLPESRAAETEEDADDNYIQIRSPTSREKISIVTATDRCRVYRESDKYRQREDVRTRAEPARPRDHRPDQTGGPKTEASQQSLVKHLREKFQSRS